MRAFAALASLLAMVASPAAAEQFVGPNGSFTLDFGPEWQVIQAQNRGGVICKAESCGADRVFCILLPRADEGATPGQALPDTVVKKFAEGVVRMPPPGMKSEFVAPFAPRTLGAVPGSWGEIVTSGDKGATHFGLFLFAAPGFDIAFSCGAPDGRWAAHRGKIETLLATAKVSASASPPAAPGPHPAEPDAQPR